MNRADREEDTRDAVAHEEQWTPASTLPVPEPMEGFGFKWVRRMSLGEVDRMNMSKRRREGWEPCTAGEQPRLAENSDSNEVIEYGGQVLCKMPNSRLAARRRYYADRATSQVTGLSNQLREAAGEVDARMPLIEERRSKTSRSAAG